jgi:hypothetical protein
MAYNLIEIVKKNKFIICVILQVILIIIFLFKNITFLKLLLVFFIFLINQLVIIYLNSREKDNTIKYDNFNEIEKKIKEELSRRTDLINKNKMNLDEWVIYNKENNILKVNDKSFYFFIFDYINHQNDFLTLVHANPKYINLTWKDLVKDQRESFPFVKEETNENLITNMFELGDYNKIRQIKYYWTDPIEQTLIKKESFFLNWSETKYKRTGVIGMGYNTNDILESNTIDYSNYTRYIFISIINFVIIIVTYSIYVLNNNHSKVKATILLVFTSTYLINFINSQELIGSFSTENTKIQNITNSVLGISFLIGVNIFILTSLKKELKQKLFVESGLVFSFSIILLLMAMFSMTNHMNIKELMENRISTQLVFNFSILLNMFVIVNYIMHVISNEKNLFLK